MLNIAVIGAGLSGLTLAHRLNNTHTVEVFEKSRGVSGRLATHYSDDASFDHGAVQFSVRDARFLNYIERVSSSSSLDVVHEWSPITAEFDQNQLRSEAILSTPRYVASPKMNQLCKALSNDLFVHSNTHIQALTRVDEEWFIKDSDNVSYGPYDWVVSSAPSVQTAEFFHGHTTDANPFANVIMSGCYSLMLGLSELDAPSWQLALINDDVLSKISLEHTKPERTSGYSVLIQSSNAWAEHMMNADESEVIELMMHHSQSLLSIVESDVTYRRLHRWRYANVEAPLGRSYWLDSESQLAACGDWCIAGRVESAFISGYELADHINSM
ncbi:MAG: NAD(P)-binding protein [Pseudomonadota bacterium]